MTSILIVILYVFFCLILVGLAYWYCLLGNYFIQSVMFKIFTWHNKRKTCNVFEDDENLTIYTQNKMGNISQISSIEHQTPNTQQQLGHVTSKGNALSEVTVNENHQNLSEDLRSRGSDMVLEMIKFEETLENAPQLDVRSSELKSQQMIQEGNKITRPMASSAEFSSSTSWTPEDRGRDHHHTGNSTTRQFSASESDQELRLTQEHSLFVSKIFTTSPSKRNSDMLSSFKNQSPPGVEESDACRMSRKISIYCDTTNLFPIETSNCSCQDQVIFSKHLSGTEQQKKSSEINDDFQNVHRMTSLNINKMGKEKCNNVLDSRKQQCKNIKTTERKCNCTDQHCLQPDINVNYHYFAVKAGSLAEQHVINKSRKGPNRDNVNNNWSTGNPQQSNPPGQEGPSDDSVLQSAWESEQLSSPNVTTFSQDYENDKGQNERRNSFTIQLIPSQRSVLGLDAFSQNCDTEAEAKKVGIVTDEVGDIREPGKERGGKTELNPIALEPTLRAKQQHNYQMVIADLQNSSRFHARRELREPGNQLGGEGEQNQIALAPTLRDKQQHNYQIVLADLLNSSRFQARRAANEIPFENSVNSID